MVWDRSTKIVIIQMTLKRYYMLHYLEKFLKIFPTPGVEPGPAGWKPAILAVRPRGILFPSGIEPETFCVLGRCDNRYTTETVGILRFEHKPNFLSLTFENYPLILLWAHVSSRDRLVVRTLRCGRSNPGSNPGHGSDLFVSQTKLCSIPSIVVRDLNV